MANNEQLEAVDLTGILFGYSATESWLGRDVSSVLVVDDITKVILLKAVTSAPTNIDIRNILASIEHATKFEPPVQILSEQIVWQALLLTKQGQYIQYLASGEWIYMTTENGGGAFRRNKKNV